MIIPIINNLGKNIKRKTRIIAIADVIIFIRLGIASALDGKFAKVKNINGPIKIEAKMPKSAIKRLALAVPKIIAFNIAQNPREIETPKKYL